MLRRLLPAICGLFLALAAAADTGTAPMPPFTHTRAEDWLNSPPLTWDQLHGKVVLLDVWTFACWNCYRSIPWVKTLEARFGTARFEVVGIHTPELREEYVLANVKKKLVEYGVEGAVMIDNDYSYWNALGNHYWPAFYLVDGYGHLVGTYVGETHAGDANAKKIEAAIQGLLGKGA